MKISEWIRHFWHELYYLLVSERGEKFALKCKEAVHQIDLAQPQKPLDQIRLNLHLSLCQACQNYFDLSTALRKSVRILIKKNENPDRLAVLNEQLMSKYSKKT